MDIFLKFDLGALEKMKKMWPVFNTNDKEQTKQQIDFVHENSPVLLV